MRSQPGRPLLPRRWALARPEAFVRVLTDDVETQLAQLQEHLRSPGADVLLLDWRAWSGMLPTRLIEGALALLESATASRRRWAILTGNTPVDVGIGRMFQIRAERHNLTVGLFVSLDQAVDWLLEPKAEAVAVQPVGFRIGQATVR